MWREWEVLRTYTCGVIDLHLGQQLSIDAEVAELTPVVVDDAVALAGHWDQTGEHTVVGTLQSSQEITGDGVDQTRPLWSEVQ